MACEPTWSLIEGESRITAFCRKLRTAEREFWRTVRLCGGGAIFVTISALASAEPCRRIAGGGHPWPRESLPGRARPRRIPRGSGRVLSDQQERPQRGINT